MLPVQSTRFNPSVDRGSHLDRPRTTLISRLALLALCATSLFGATGCRVIEGIFKVGWWVGVLTVVVVLALVGGVASMVMKRRG